MKCYVSLALNQKISQKKKEKIFPLNSYWYRNVEIFHLKKKIVQNIRSKYKKKKKELIDWQKKLKNAKVKAKQFRVWLRFLFYFCWTKKINSICKDLVQIVRDQDHRIQVHQEAQDHQVVAHGRADQVHVTQRPKSQLMNKQIENQSKNKN